MIEIIKSPSEYPVFISKSPEETREVYDKIIAKFPQMKNLSEWLKAGKNPFEQPDFLRSLENLDSKQVQILFDLWGWQFFYEITISKILEQNPKYARLKAIFLDPAIGCRADIFLKFIEENNLHQTSYAKLRQLFSNYLGEDIVYRSLVVTPQQAKEIKNSGMESPGELHGINPLVSFLRISPVGGIKEKYQLVEGSLYHSVTKDEDFAGSVGNWTLFHPQKSRQRPPKGSKIYVFKMKVPKIWLITRQNLGAFGEGSTDNITNVYTYKFDTRQGMQSRLKNDVVLTTEELEKKATFVGKLSSEEVESFIFNQIPSENILGYNEYTLPTVFIRTRETFNQTR